MAPGESAKLLKVVLGKEVGNDKDDGVLLRDVTEKPQHGLELGLAPFRFEVDQGIHDAQCVGAPFTRRNNDFDLVGEKNQADAVLVLGCSHGQ